MARKPDAIQSAVFRSTVDAVGRGNAVGLNLRAELQKIADRVARLIETTEGEFTREHLKRILVQLKAALRDFDRQALSELRGGRRDHFEDAWRKVQAKFLDLPELQGQFPIPIMPIEKIVIAATSPLGGSPLAVYTARIAAKTYKRAKTELGIAIAKGDGPAKLARVLREAIGVSQASAMRLARTAILDVNNKALLDVYRQNDDVISDYEYVTALDTRVCPICGPWDGQLRNTVAEFPKLPRHPNCRCVISPMTRLSEPVERIAYLSEERKVTQHRDGSTTSRFVNRERTKTTMNYRELFEAQPTEWQKERLGPTKYKAWKSGKLDLWKLRRGQESVALA